VLRAMDCCAYRLMYGGSYRTDYNGHDILFSKMFLYLSEISRLYSDSRLLNAVSENTTAASLQTVHSYFPAVHVYCVVLTKWQT